LDWHVGDLIEHNQAITKRLHSTKGFRELYSEIEGSRKTIGDVDIIFHDGIYHLFHLVLPNHDFIAHAVSEDGLSWQRVKNALFIGHPGSWDDSMLWTMHVSPDPHTPGRWRMFYTGLSRYDRGLKQRIGMATSDDLFHWEKSAVSWKDHRPALLQNWLDDARLVPETRYDADSCFPLEPDPDHYEAAVDEGRHWVSFRDPFFFREDGLGWLLCSGRVRHGPITRRGCVAILEETAPNHFESRQALYHPGLYDDIEVPNLLRIDSEYYLIGSLREDAKIRYWHTDKIGNPWRSYHDNVLLAAGNYAGRICKDDQGWLIWNFFTHDPTERTSENLMPPPKRIMRMENGLLRARPYERIGQRLLRESDTSYMFPLRCSESSATCDVTDRRPINGDGMRLTSDSGFEAFVFPEQVNCFRFSSKLELCGLGKCGIVFRLSPEQHDGYYLSLDLTKGVAQMRAWGTGPAGSGEHMMQFESLQSGYWYNQSPGSAHVDLIVFGSYLELSIDDNVILSLADQKYHHGYLGVYVESAVLDLKQIKLQHLQTPQQSDEHLAVG
jgi:beta-fructofuranosidase